MTTKSRTQSTIPKRDSLIDVIRTEAQREGYLKGGNFDLFDYQQKRSVSQFAEKAGISDSTVRNWFSRKTKRPQALTMRFALEALGITTCLRRSDGKFVKGWGK